METPEKGEPKNALLTDEFMLNEFKVTRCQKRYRHNWRKCPYAHEKETASRRDPSIYNYRAEICPEAKKKEGCPRGIDCPCAHNVFEYWLLQSRYKTELCKHGNKEACKSKRAFCFFAHSEEELRAVPENETISLEADFSSKEPQALQPSTLEAHLSCQHLPVSDFCELWEMDEQYRDTLSETTTQFPHTSGTSTTGVARLTSFLDMNVAYESGYDQSGAMFCQQQSGSSGKGFKEQKKNHIFDLGSYVLERESAAMGNAHTACLASRIPEIRLDDSQHGKKLTMTAEELQSSRILKILKVEPNRSSKVL